MANVCTAFLLPSLRCACERQPLPSVADRRHLDAAIDSMRRRTAAESVRHRVVLLFCFFYVRVNGDCVRPSPFAQRLRKWDSARKHDACRCQVVTLLPCRLPSIAVCFAFRHRRPTLVDDFRLSLASMTPSLPRAGNTSTDSVHHRVVIPGHTGCRLPLLRCSTERR